MREEYVLQMNMGANCKRCQELINFFIFKYDIYLGNFFRMKQVSRSPITGIIKYEIDGEKEVPIKVHQTPSEVAKLLVALGHVDGAIFEGKNISLEFLQWKDARTVSPDKYRRKKPKK
jgi:hypothetical protein